MPFEEALHIVQDFKLSKLPEGMAIRIIQVPEVRTSVFLQMSILIKVVK